MNGMVDAVPSVPLESARKKDLNFMLERKLPEAPGKSEVSI